MPITRIGTYSQIQGTSFKLPCRVATTAAITLSGTQTIDGVAVVAGDRVLVKDQGTGSANGIYIVAASTWSRAVDMSIDEDMFEGLMMYVNSGSANGDKTFYLNTANPITLGVTSLTFTSTLTNPVTGTGTTNYLPKWTSSSALGNSLVYDNGTNVGIGTTTPARGLSIFNKTIGLYSSTTGQGLTDGYTMELEGTTAYLWNYENDSLIFGTNSSERMRITSSGNVGIGTTSPAYKLEVSGTVGINNTLYLTKGASDTVQLGSSVYLVGGSGASYTQLQQGVGRFTIWGFNGSFWKETLTINNTSGNVGIGTTSPSEKLTINSGAANSGTNYAKKNIVVNSGFTSGYTVNTIQSLLAGYDATIYGTDIGYGYDGTGYTLMFSTNDNTSGDVIERMRITSGGQLKLNNYTSTSAFTGTAVGYLGFDSSGNILSSAVPAGSTVTFNRQAASYTLVLADAGKMVEMNVATANNLTVPLNSSVAFPIGTQIDVTQYGAGQTTFVATGGVTIRSTNSWLKMNAQYGAATLVKVGTDEWYLFGNINA